MNYGIWINGELMYSDEIDDDNFLKNYYDVSEFEILDEFQKIRHYLAKYKTIFVVSKESFMYYHNRKYDYGILYDDYTNNQELTVVNGCDTIDDNKPIIYIANKIAAKIGDIFWNCESLDEMVQFLTPNFDKYLQSFHNTMNDMSGALTLSMAKSAD